MVFLNFYRIFEGSTLVCRNFDSVVGVCTKVLQSISKFAVRLWNSVRIWQRGDMEIRVGGGWVGSPKSQKRVKNTQKQGQSDPKT